MENNLEELNKEFEDNFGNPNKEYILQEDRAKLWQWFSSKLSECVPKSEYNSDLAKVTFQGLDEQKLIQQLTAQIAELKTENEKLKESMSGDRIEMAILKAKNEKLQEVVSQTANLLTNSILDSENLVAEARQSERARVKKAIESVLLKRLMDNSIDFISINATQLSEEFDKAITADQQGKTV